MGLLYLLFPYILVPSTYKYSIPYLQLSYKQQRWRRSCLGLLKTITPQIPPPQSVIPAPRRSSTLVNYSFNPKPDEVIEPRINSQSYLTLIGFTCGVQSQTPPPQPSVCDVTVCEVNHVAVVYTCLVSERRHKQQQMFLPILAASWCLLIFLKILFLAPGTCFWDKVVVILINLTESRHLTSPKSTEIIFWGKLILFFLVWSKSHLIALRGRSLSCI